MRTKEKKNRETNALQKRLYQYRAWCALSRYARTIDLRAVASCVPVLAYTVRIASIILRTPRLFCVIYAEICVNATPAAKPRKQSLTNRMKYASESYFPVQLLPLSHVDSRIIYGRSPNRFLFCFFRIRRGDWWAQSILNFIVCKIITRRGRNVWPEGTDAGHLRQFCVSEKKQINVGMEKIQQPL